MHIDMCKDTCTGVCTDMSVARDRHIDLQTEMRMDWCIGLRMDMCIGLCIEMGIGMCMVVCMDMHEQRKKMATSAPHANQGRQHYNNISYNTL